MTSSGESTDNTDRVTQRSLTIEHSKVNAIIDRLVAVAENLSTGFDKWNEKYVSGPSLYFLVIADAYYGSYTDPLGENRWPTDVCRTVTGDLDSLTTATRDVAFSYDGAVVVTVDGTIQEQMVRVKTPAEPDAGESEKIDYADWMGTKHLSAVEISTQKEVLATVTLSEENGRVTLFERGQYVDRRRSEIGGRWESPAETQTPPRDQ
ncbi:MAG: diadenylate cyclase [Halovenus sp.]